MLRIYYTAIRNFFRFMGALKTMEDMTELSKTRPEEFNEKVRYGYVQYVIDVMMKTGRITTKAYGKENLPETGGYMMYANHQGKWDAYGIIASHKEPCTFVMDVKKSNFVFIRHLVDILYAKRLAKDNNRQAMIIINEVVNDVKEGKKYIFFPEGKYDTKRKNEMGEFRSGSFKVCSKSKVPMVPVAIIDSYKVYNTCSLKPVTSEVHFLEPICYEEYKDLTTRQMADLVKSRIEEKIKEVEESRKSK